MYFNKSAELKYFKYLSKFNITDQLKMILYIYMIVSVSYIDKSYSILSIMHIVIIFEILCE